MNIEYMQLVKVNKSDIWDEVQENGYNDLAEMYTLACDYNYENIYSDKIDISETRNEQLVSLIGRRCYTHTGEVYIANDGTVWLKSDDYEKYFC